MILGPSQIQSRLRPSVLHSLLFSFQNLISLTGCAPMEKDAIHRMATLITQLTLCQVSIEEIEVSADVLEKPAHS